MRIRNGLVLCLVLTSIVGVGCRKALAPNIDRNQAPETWITAAPQDTVTIRDATGKIIGDTQSPKTIPSKFHIYWAGSDPDGSIAGFYYAVVETLPQPIAGSTEVPPLPGPKARDYRFTARTDSTFIFTVSDFASDRMHAFYIYAVDNEGKADPTPARVIFNAQDNYPPLVLFTRARATGLIWARPGNGLAPVQVPFAKDITDPGDTSSIVVRTLPRDTIPTSARLDFAWRSEPVVAGNPTVAYRYKLDEPDFIQVDSSVTSVTYNSGVNDAVGPGTKILTLRAIDVAGAKREIKRRFQFNFAPDTWISGPDPNSGAFNLVEAQTGYHYMDATQWFTLLPGNVVPRMPAIAGSLLSPDSLFLMPSTRPERKTFFEIYQNKIYVHVEGDTVNMNSYVISHSGGLDADSPYNVQVNPSDPQVKDLIQLYQTLPPLLTAGPANGSPIAFRSNMGFSEYPTGTALWYSQSNPYPNYDPSSVTRTPQAAYYWLANTAGKAYMFARSIGSYGVVPGDVDAAVTQISAPGIVAASPDGTTGPDSVRALRRKILTFYVDHVPVLATGDGGFIPKPGANVTRQIFCNLVTNDLDYYDASAPSSIKLPGGWVKTATNFRYGVVVHGQNAAGRDTIYIEPFHTNGSFMISVPAYITSTTATLEIQVCDCLACEDIPGSGTCAPAVFIPVVIGPVPPSGASGASSLNLRLNEPGPGSVQAVRSTVP